MWTTHTAWRACGVLAGGLLALSIASSIIVRTQSTAVRWDALPEPVRTALRGIGVADASSFDAWRDRVRATNAARLRDGDFDHLIHYALQSRRLTSLPPIEPALSAKAFVEAFPPDERARLLTGGRDRDGDAAARTSTDARVKAIAGAGEAAGAGAAVLAKVPRDAQARLSAMAAALTGSPGASPGSSSPASSSGSPQDARLAHFRDIVGDVRGPAVEARLRGEYVRAMRFLYEKEFVAERSAQSAADVATLYRTRGHSSDTEIEAGYGVYVALASVKQIEPARPIARVLIVGPGLDLAPRTGLLEEADPQSYQPFAVADALLGLGLSHRATLRIEAADLNPHVAAAIARAVRAPALRLFVTSGIADDRRTQMTDDYRAYLATFGRAIEARPRSSATAGGETTGRSRPSPDTASAATAGTAAASSATAPAPATVPGPASADGHIRKVIPIARDVQAAIVPRQLDIVTDRAGDESFDLVIVTNVLPYLADAELAVALANIAAALAPGGLLIHNEARPLMLSATTAIGLPAILARTMLIAKVPTGRDLYDTIWIHKKPAIVEAKP